MADVPERAPTGERFNTLTHLPGAALATLGLVALHTAQAHGIFHVFVLAGSACHFVAVWFWVA